jgi:hypothetical protein
VGHLFARIILAALLEELPSSVRESNAVDEVMGSQSPSANSVATRLPARATRGELPPVRVRHVGSGCAEVAKPLWSFRGSLVERKYGPTRHAQR